MPVRPSFVQTTRQPSGTATTNAPRVPVVVIAHHPKLSRIGEAFQLPHGVTEISRLSPGFSSVVDRIAIDRRADDDAAALDDPFVSRRAIALHHLEDGSVEIARATGESGEISIEGVALALGAKRAISTEALTRGVALVLGARVVLWLTSAFAVETNDLGLVGRSAAMQQLRAQIRDAAHARGPILLRGETGTGKELVARAVHSVGPRARGPFVGVNVAAIPAAVAAAELFGHARGAFTGANERRAGYFERGDGGVVFLDEVGEVAEAIQPVLLRALESGEIQPVGGEPRVVDACVIAATDADLEAAVRAGRMRAPLMYRLASTVIEVPALRVRGADIAILLARFLIELLPSALADRTTDPAPWLPAGVMVAALRAPWPGNVRELRNVATRLAAIARRGEVATLAALGLDDDVEHARVPDAPPSAVAGAIDDDRLVATLRAHGFQLARTAEALGVSRTHLDALIARSGRVRKANQLARDEIAACIAELGDDLDAVAARLEVSPRGLRLRMKQLGW